MTESEERNAYIENKKISLLVANLSFNMPGTVINSLIISLLLWNVIPTRKILVWASVNILFVIIRYLGFWVYRKGFKVNDIKFWKRMLFFSFIIAGLLFGSSAIFLVDPARIEYIIFLYFVAGGMVAGSLGSYHNHLPVFFAYSSSVFLIPTVAIYNLNTSVTTTMSLLGLIFYLLAAINARKMNTDLSEALALRYDNYQLIRNLNSEKKSRESLNEQLMEKNSELKSLTRIDPLTGLKNRRYLFEEFTPHHTRIMRKRWLELQGKNKRSPSDHYGYGIFMLDIDKFKLVNDNYGHDSGDMVLKQFSARLIEKVRDDDVVARLGGEEFTLVLNNTDEEYLDQFAEIIRSSIESIPFNITQGRTIHVTTSIGFVFYPFFRNFPVHMTFEQMISLADKALYHAKKSGRNLSVRVDCSEKNTKDPGVVDMIVSDPTDAVERGQISFQVCTA